MLLAFFGGIYNNYLALEAAIADARRRGAGELYCLGDLGAFGPHPETACGAACFGQWLSTTDRTLGALLLAVFTCLGQQFLFLGLRLSHCT